MLLPSNYGDFGAKAVQAPRKPQTAGPVRAAQPVRAPVPGRPAVAPAGNLGAVLQRLMVLEQRVARSEAQVKQLQRVLQALLARRGVPRRQAASRGPVQAEGPVYGPGPQGPQGGVEEEVLEPEVMPREGEGITPEEARQAIENAQYGEPDGSDEFEAMIDGEDEAVLEDDQQ